MADDAHDSWLGVLGIDVDRIRAKVQSVASSVETTVDQGIDSVVRGATQLYQDAENGITQIAKKVENVGGEVVDAVKKGVDIAKTKALGDQSGKPVPRPMEADCKPEHGYVPGPKNHLLCATHGHVIDIDQGMIIAASVATYIKDGAAAALHGLDARDAIGDGLRLTPPSLGGTPGQQSDLPPNLQLHFQLSPDEVASCNRYLDAHFDAALINGAPPIIMDSYKPSLDGKSVTIDAVVQALIPLTTAAASKDGTDQLFKDTTSQLYDLVNSRYGNLVLSKTTAATNALGKNAVQAVLAASTEAETWTRNCLAENNLRPNVVDDGTGAIVLFDDKPTQFETMVSTVVAAGHLADLKSGELGRSLITAERVTRIAREVLAAAVPSVPKRGGGAQNVSVYLQYTFTPETVHTPINGGGDSSDQPAHALTGQMTWEFHADNQSGLEISAFGQLTWFADKRGGHITNQSGFTGAQVAWVWSFLDGALQAGPLFQALVGASRAQERKSDTLVWTPTGQVGAGGQVQYAIPGFKGHLLIGVQAGGSLTDPKGSDPTIDRATAFTITFKL